MLSGCSSSFTTVSQLADRMATDQQSTLRDHGTYPQGNLAPEHAMIPSSNRVK